MTRAFAPQPLAALLSRALEELRRERRIFDLPRRSFWSGRDGLDLSVAVQGCRAATPAGPAAGPHTQLAQNLALAWLAGGRVLELKTVQMLDRLEIARPCIDAPDLGYNVEWSQELALEESLEQYATGWLLIHALARMDVNGAPPERQATVFDASVGYDLAGIRCERVARFLDGIVDAAAVLADVRDHLPSGLRRAADVEAPPRIASSVTLSTFHGCPADEIEDIVEHLFARHCLHVTIKLNPTLLGHDEADDLLRGRLGYEELRLDPEAFAKDLRWDEAIAMFGRLSATADRLGLGLAAKFTNTLVVGNPGRVFSDPVVYLSGPPLHVLAVRLADRFARETGGRIPVSFSAGVDADNFHEVVACGMRPVTACTDLLKPTGYRRMARYLKRLEEEMAGAGATTVAEYILARRAARFGAAADPSLPEYEAVRLASLANLAAYAEAVADDPRYHAANHRDVPRREPTRLTLFDCASCNACVVVCPNDAFFSMAIGPVTVDTWDVVIEGGEARTRPARLEIARDTQWALFADFCNACGNCDTFCPEHGGPHRAKPRFVGSRARFDETAPDDAILVERCGAGLRARFAGTVYTLAMADGGARFDDGTLEVALDERHRVIATRVLEPREGHVLPLARYHALRLLADGVCAGVNPVSVGYLPVARDVAPA